MRTFSVHCLRCKEYYIYYGSIYALKTECTEITRDKCYKKIRNYLNTQ